VWEFSAERFTVASVLDAFEQILPEDQEASPRRTIPGASSVALAGINGKRNKLVESSLLVTTPPNFYPYIASTHCVTNWPSAGRNKQADITCGKSVSVTFLDGEHGLSLCHHVYPGMWPR